MKKLYRHGDIVFVRTDKLGSGEKVKGTNNLVIAEGETTGHKHLLTIADIMDMEAYRLPDGAWSLHLKAEGVVTHEEHGTITLPAGDYKVYRKREKDWFMGAVRKIVD